MAISATSLTIKKYDVKKLRLLTSHDLANLIGIPKYWLKKKRFTKVPKLHKEVFRECPSFFVQTTISYFYGPFVSFKHEYSSSTFVEWKRAILGELFLNYQCLRAQWWHLMSHPVWLSNLQLFSFQPRSLTNTMHYYSITVMKVWQHFQNDALQKQLFFTGVLCLIYPLPPHPQGRHEKIQQLDSCHLHI